MKTKQVFKGYFSFLSSNINSPPRLEVEEKGSREHLTQGLWA